MNYKIFAIALLEKSKIGSKVYKHLNVGLTRSRQNNYVSAAQSKDQP